MEFALVRMGTLSRSASSNPGFTTQPNDSENKVEVFQFENEINDLVEPKREVTLKEEELTGECHDYADHVEK
jgi:hypothetical protein